MKKYYLMEFPSGLGIKSKKFFSSNYTTVPTLREGTSYDFEFIANIKAILLAMNLKLTFIVEVIDLTTNDKIK